MLLKSILAPFTTTGTLKILYIRKSSVDMEDPTRTSDMDSDDDSMADDDLEEFANCAFGPDGLPTLKLLAFGDFSYDGRFHASNKLLCTG
jgi:hypothetical protein